MHLLEITWWELISLLGLIQSVWLIVYMTLRAGRIRYASLALACFSCLGLAFLADFGTRYLHGLEIYPLLQDVLWYVLPVLSVLLAMQIAKVEGLPDRKYFLILILVPVMMTSAWVVGGVVADCPVMSTCGIEDRRSILALLAVLIGGISLLCLWARRDLLDGLRKDKSLRSDRYWVILALILMNCGLVCLTLAYAWGAIQIHEFLITRGVLGCGLVYLTSTSLFRLYPQTLRVAPKISSEFNKEEAELIIKLEDLIGLQKVYQEPGFSRGDLARELGTSEAVITRLVNIHFGKSVPQLLNEKRIADAQLLLQQTTAPVSVVFEQVGFNSVASFNRVFKEITGLSPTEFRERKSS